MSLHQAYVIFSALALAFVGTLPTSAQQLSALKGHDSNQQIDVSADHLELREKENLAIFSGAVRVVQGDLILIANQLRVFYGNQGEGSSDLSILRLDAEGEVKLTSPSEVVDSHWGVYDVEEEVITLGGTVSMQRGDTRLNGERLVLNLRSGQSTLDGGASSEGERVRGRFTVPQKTPEGQAETPPSDNL